MLATTPVTAARILNFEHLPKAYEGRSTAPPLHEPKLLHIADLFLSNRHPHDLSCLARDDPKRSMARSGGEQSQSSKTVHASSFGTHP